MSMSWRKGRAASTSMPRLSRTKYPTAKVGRTLEPMSSGRVPSARAPLPESGFTSWAPTATVQSPLDWARAAGAARLAATARARRERVLRDMAHLCGVGMRAWCARPYAAALTLVKSGPARSPLLKLRVVAARTPHQRGAAVLHLTHIATYAV